MYSGNPGPDDYKYWRFERNSKLPMETFSSTNEDVIVVIVAILCLIVGLLVSNL